MTKTLQDDLSHHQSGRARRAYTGVLWSGVNALLPAASGLVVFLVVSRIISPEEFGFVAFAVAIVGALGAFSPAGFGDALVQRTDLGAPHLNATFWLCLLWGVLLYALASISALPLSILLDDPMLAVLIPVIGLRLIMDLAAVVPTALLSRKMEFRQLALRTLISSVMSLVVCLLVLWMGYGLWALVMSQLIGALVVCAVSWISVSWRPVWGVDRQALRDLLNFGGFASGSRLITTINVDQLLIGAFMGPVALGLFSFARRIFMILNDVLTGALASVSYPLLSSMQAEPEKLRETYLATTFLSSVLSFPIFVGFALISDQAIPLIFGTQWQDATPALQAFCAIGLLSCIGILQASLIRAKGRADWWMWYQVVKQVMMALVVLLLFPLGITPVVIGIAVITWLIWPVIASVVARMLDLSLQRYLAQFIPPLFGCVVMAAVVLASGHWIDQSPTITLIVQIVAGALTYGITLLAIPGPRLKALFGTLSKKRR